MRFLGRLLGALVILVAVLVAVAFVLPREVVVTRTAMIGAPPEAVFPHINSLQASQAWSPWNARDPDMVQVFEGPEMGVGNKMIWTSDQRNVGNGSQEITASVENERVVTALDFGPQGTAEAWLALVPTSDGTEVTWGLRTDMGMNPVGRWMGLFFDSMMGPDYEAGLGMLKDVVETDR